MAKKSTDEGLGTRVDLTEEIQPTKAAEEARAEIESAIIIARNPRFARNETAAYQSLMHACKRTGFADAAQYSIPRWNSKLQKNEDIVGPSVKLAREAGRLWGNIRWGIVVLADSEEDRTIEGWAYDLQTNVRVCQQDTFTKMVMRRGKWQSTEGDVRELTARRGAFLVRNSLLQLIPSDFIDDAMAECDKTMEVKDKQDPEAQKKAIIGAFDGIGVSVADLEAYIGHGLDKNTSPAEIKKLRGIYKSIEDGNRTWADYISSGEPASEQKKSSGPTPTASTNDRASSTPAATQASHEAPILEEKKLSLIRQMVTKKGWTPVQYQEVLAKLGFRSEAQITEVALPNIMNILVAGPGAAPSNTSAEQAAEPAAAAPVAGNGGNGKPGEKISDVQKGQVWQIARGKRWAKGSGTPDDPLHLFLRDYYKIDSVTKIRVADLEEITASLDLGPAKYKYTPVE